MADSTQSRGINPPTELDSTGVTYKFSYVPGVFEDYAEIAKLSPNGKVSTQPSLGILEQVYDVPTKESALNEKIEPQWVQFANYVRHLNKKHAEGGISYKLIYLIRHGRGIHNVKMDELKASEEAGTLEQIDGKLANWKNYWSHQNGDGKVTWVDPYLVDKGILEAADLSKLWLYEARKDALPLPETVYTSPLARCLETTKLVYTKVLAEHGRRLQPVVKERLRERITNHTCDKRSRRSWIENNYPDFIIEDGFSEFDESWNANASESLEQHIARMQQLFDDIFTHDTSPVISLTAHSYTITAILAVVGYPEFLVTEGTIVPLLVRAESTTPNLQPPLMYVAA
ncbi:phosphoglycerate mutase-like protein [Hypoxylon rubiginosum]|uniref:Phosphoglycerate mutase-like protein n=1 Tax=Hypoxylon rubiginosum TaxID=110542 RepID=A0ACC0D733_9PEZI|nr:phosphoglycerate mutase-like protein [Hypoxylon rubiginosum]